MKITNRIINILVLVLAAASAVFAYFLFNKREFLVGGWNEMASAISATAKQLDKDSGTNAAKDLTPDKLAHTNFKNGDLAALNTSVKNLQKQSEKVIQQRNTLARTIEEITKIDPSVKKVNASDLQKIDSSAKSSSDAVQRMKELQKTNDQIFLCYKRALSKLNIEVSSNKKANDYVVLEGKVTAKVNAYNNRIGSLEKNLRAIASSLNVRFYSTNGDYTNAANEMIGAINANKRELSQTKRDLASEKRTSQDLRNQVRNRDNKIAGLNKTIQQKDKNIKDLKYKINPDDGVVTIDNKTLYATEVMGKIESIDKKWGFVVINLGQKIPVTRKFPKTKKDRVEYLKIQKNDRMTVGRNLKGEKPAFVAKIQITQVNKDHAFGNIINADGTLRPESDIEPGDNVYFAEEDIKRMDKERLARLNVDPKFLATAK